MGAHTYDTSSFLSPIDVQYIRELIVADSPALVATDAEVQVYLEHVDHPGKVFCDFTPTLTAPQVTQLDAIMSGYSGRPSLSPPDGGWTDEVRNSFSTTSTSPSFHSCQVNSVTCDPGLYEITWSATARVGTSDSMEVRFELDGSALNYTDPLFDSSYPDDETIFTAKTTLAVTERRQVDMDTLFCRTWAGGYTVYIEDLVQTIRRLRDDR